jgi:acetyltransferase
MQHYLRPLVSPASVALVGASERAGSTGRIVLANLLDGGFKGPIYAINPKHRSVLGLRSHASLRAIAAPVELAVIAIPAAAVAGALEDAGAAGIEAAVLMTPPPASGADAWNREVQAVARRNGIRLIGAGAFGVVRTDIGLNATFCAPRARPGRLALVAQSGAVAMALLDFAAPQHFGFSTVISLGTGLGAGFAELLDCLVLDPVTDGILMFIEELREARPFLSALRSAARTKPVIVLKAGRSLEARRDPSADAVFDAALRRGGAVRVRNYTELFAAARILATGRIPRSDRLAIVSNGRGPALLAADSVLDRGVELARLAHATRAALDRLLPDGSLSANPVDLRGDAPPARMAEAVALLARDPGVDAVLALHVARPAMPADEAARAVAGVTHGLEKPVLGAWLGALDRPDVHAELERGGIANFYTPENAVTAFSFLATYRRNQAMLLEAPALQPEPEPLDYDVAERLRARLAETGRTNLLRGEIEALLAAFGVVLSPAAAAFTLDEARAAAARLDFPVTLSAAHGERTRTRVVETAAALDQAWNELAGSGAREGSEHPLVRVEKPGHAHVLDLDVHVATDPLFGPVVTLRHAGRPSHDAGASMLPPLSRSLARDLIAAARSQRAAPAIVRQLEADEALVRLLLRISTLFGALPWLVELELTRIGACGESAVVGAAHARADTSRRMQPGYRHMAIHPYPAELIERVALPDGAEVTVRPIRPEDAELETEFVQALSPDSRYYRFFYQLNELSPAMLARFTQVDYDREMALVAVADVAHPHGHPVFVGVARYIANPDGESAEFAVVVADAWQKRGVARALMARLVASATRRGFARLEGTILRANARMLAFAEAFGFVVRDDVEDAEQVVASLELR